MKKCSTCGTEIPDNATNCPTCGEAVVSSGEATHQTTSPEPQKKKGKAGKIIIAIVVILIILFAVGSCSKTCSKSESSRSEDWPTGQLAQMIPSMDRKCESVIESEDHLSITVSDRISKSNYNTYVTECKEQGFTVDATDGSDEYDAYNTEGYRLNVKFSDYSSNKINIDFNAPKVNGALAWPTMGLATKIPNPEKAKGSVAIDSASQFAAYVGEMSKEEFGAYIDKCIEAGFNVDYSKTDTVFDADNAQGDSLRLEYQGFNTMYISIYAAKGESSSSSASSSSSGIVSSNSNAVTNSGSSMKEVMDEYEKFIDDYIAFMEKYNNSSNPASMALDYAKLTSDYAKMMEKINAIDESSLSEADYQYYIEVTTRVNNKLTNAALL